jgi:hypothetical protein
MPHPARVVALLSLFVFVVSARAHAPAADMLNAANAFLSSLDSAQKKQATYEMTNAERENWNFVPTARSGLPLKQMTPAQHDLAFALLRSGLGEAGLTRTEAVMSLENVLKELENGAARRDPTNYFVTIFGTPAAATPWGWRFEGHHLSFNFTVVDGSHVFFAPTFIGSNPGEVKSGPKKGLRVLGTEEDDGIALIKSLDDVQRKSAIFSADAPKEIITGNSHHVTPLSPAGLLAAQFTTAQKEKLVSLIKLYLSRSRPELADATWKEISAAGVDNITFGWAGAIERGAGSYYRIQGPTFLLEFDNTQNNANHVHTVFREFKGDFGQDLLREHYANEHGK